MTSYKLVPVEKLKEWEATINTIALQMAFDIADDIAQYSYTPAVQREPVGYVSPRLLDALRSGKACGITMEDKPDAHNGVTVPLYTAPKPAEQPTISTYACTVPDDCETLHWRGQILSMNELVSVAQPVVDEEIHVHIEGRDVLTLPLAPSGMNAPRFVVYVPAQTAEQHPAPDVAELQTECEKLRRDAKRYQWLRDGNNEENSEATIIASYFWGDKWDNMIDDAMAT